MVQAGPVTVVSMTSQHDMYWTQGLHRSLQQQPDVVATIFGERKRTFAEQADRVARFAGALREMGVRDGARVGILALNSDRYAEALLAVAWADGVFSAIDSMRAPFEIAPMLGESDTGYSSSTMRSCLSYRRSRKDGPVCGPSSTWERIRHRPR